MAINVLGIDISKAFDNAVRELIVDVFRPILDEDGLRMLHIILTDTFLRVKVGEVFGEVFVGNTGTPQGGSLSPIIFIVYKLSYLNSFLKSLTLTFVCFLCGLSLLMTLTSLIVLVTQTVRMTLST